jgi:hypothetical protein
VLELVATAAVAATLNTEVPVRATLSSSTESLAAFLGYVGETRLRGAVEEVRTSDGVNVLVTTRVVAAETGSVDS